MTAKQRPLWMVERHDKDDGSITYEIWDNHPDNYRRVVVLNDGFVEEGKHARKDAATIVRAVNSHDDMLAALRNIAEGNLGDDPWQANYEKIRDVARAAISKAEPAL